ncbi:MAG: hypothetical protein AAFW75_26180 [Cyanobacteria bacterium J06636_16]
MGELAMSLDSHQKLDYLYQEYTRLANRAIEHYKSVYDDIKLFGAIGASVILWKLLYDFISSSQTIFESNLVLLVGFLGIEVLLGFISSFNLIKQVNTWYFVHNLQAYELKINQILEKGGSTNVFHFYQGLSESRYINGVYRTTYLFFLLYVRLAVIAFPLAVLSFVNVIYALAFLAFALLNTGTLLLVAKRAYRYYPSKDLVGFKYLITHLLRKGPID